MSNLTLPAALLVCCIADMKRMSVMLSVLLFCIAAQAQIFQFTREQMIEYTANNPYDRFPDGRPKVPDELLKKLQDISAEEVWTVLSRNHYNNQFSDHWRIVHPEKHLIGSAVTAQFMPLRDDVQQTAEAKANGNGPKRNANQRVIDSLQNGDTIVVDLYGSRV